MLPAAKIGLNSSPSTGHAEAPVVKTLPHLWQVRVPITEIPFLSDAVKA
jgi:hypothetical protein